MKKLSMATELGPSFTLPVEEPAKQRHRLSDSVSHEERHPITGHRTSKLMYRPAHGDYFIKKNDTDYIRVSNRYFHLNWVKRFGTMELHWEGRFGKWCPCWDRNAYVDRQWLKKVDKPDGHWIH